MLATSSWVYATVSVIKHSVMSPMHLEVFQPVIHCGPARMLPVILHQAGHLKTMVHAEGTPRRARAMGSDPVVVSITTSSFLRLTTTM